MTKEITKAIILQEMQDKLRLREFTPSDFLFDETVVPVYNIEQHLEKWVSEYAEISVTSATHFSFFTVPFNERWSLGRYDFIFMGAGGFKITGLYLIRKGGSIVYLDMKAAQTVSYHVELYNPVHLNPGDSLHVLVDDYTSTQSLRLYIDYMMEEIR